MNLSVCSKCPSKQHQWQRLSRFELNSTQIEEIDEKEEKEEKEKTKIIYCCKFHPCTIEKQEISCKFCYQVKSVFCWKICDENSVKNRLPCNDKVCKELYQMEISLMKFIFSRLISPIRWNKIPLSFFMSNVEPVLQGLNLLSDSNILQIIKELYCKKNKMIDNLSRYNFDDNVFDLMKYNNKIFRFRYDTRFWVVDGKNTHNTICPTLRKHINGIEWQYDKPFFKSGWRGALREVGCRIVIKNNFQSTTTGTILSLENGKYMQAKHWVFGGNNNNDNNDYQNSIDDSNPWYRVRVVKHETPFVYVKLDIDHEKDCNLAKKYGNDCSWWLFDENYKMLRNVV